MKSGRRSDPSASRSRKSPDHGRTIATTDIWTSCKRRSYMLRTKPEPGLAGPFVVTPLQHPGKGNDVRIIAVYPKQSDYVKKEVKDENNT